MIGRGPRAPLVALGASGVVLLGLALAWVASRGRSLDRTAVAPAPAPTAEPPPATVAPPSPSPPGCALVLQPGPLEGQDAEVHCDGWYQNDNAGSSIWMRVGDRAAQRGDMRSLLRFTDLALLPAGTAVERAVLSLWLVGSTDQTADLRIQARALLPTPGRTPWAEGTSRFDELVDGVCWDGDGPGVPFPGKTSRRPELGQPDADLGTDWGRGLGGVVAEVVVAPGGAPRWVELDITPLVRAWVAGRVEPVGLQLAHAHEDSPWQDGHVLFFTSDAADPTLRPRLVVEHRGPELAVPDRTAEYDAARREATDLLARVAPGLDADEAMRLAHAAVTRAPFLGRAYWARGRLALRHGLPHAAIDLMMATSVSEPVTEGGVVRDRALVRLRQRAAEEVLDDCAQLEALEPGDPYLPWMRGSALLIRGDLQLALETLGKAQLAGPYVPTAPAWAFEDDGTFQSSILRTRGEALLASGREPEGIDSLMQATLFAPGASGPALVLARVHARGGRVEAARTILREALAHRPDPAVEAALRDLDGGGR